LARQRGDGARDSPLPPAARSRRQRVPRQAARLDHSRLAEQLAPEDRRLRRHSGSAAAGRRGTPDGVRKLRGQRRRARRAPAMDAESAPIDQPRFAPGYIFAGRYRIVSLLGRGAMGEVYRADDLRLEQTVALKLLAAHGGAAEDATLRFAREVRLARGVAHPNVCRVYDIGDADGWHYLSMADVDGETLSPPLHRIGRLPPGTTP